MPRKCNNVKKDKLLLMRTIKSRLIKISMKVENYIYKEKMISSIQAKTFLEEIYSYEPQCDGDVQCLQVIEKLTRYMNIVLSNETNINNNVDNNLELETMRNDGHEITNISSPICEVANKNVDENENQKNQCNITNAVTEYNENCTNSNINESNIKLEDMMSTKDTKINNGSELKSISISKNKPDKMLEINSIAPVDLGKPLNSNPITYNNREISLNEDNATSTPIPQPTKLLNESDKTESTNVTKVTHKLINNYKTNKKCMRKNVTPKSNIIQQSKTMQGSNIKVIQPCYPPIIKKPQESAAETSKNIVTIIAKEKPIVTLYNNKVQSEITNINNEDNVKKNVTDKPKTTKETNNNEKLVTNEESKDKKVKRRCKAKTNQTKAKKSKELKKSNMKLDLSWFDDIKFIREVDEKEYFTVKD